MKELNIINELEKVSDVTIALTLDDSDNNMFLLNKKTFQKLSEQNEVEAILLDKQKRFNNEELKHLEENYNEKLNTFSVDYVDQDKNFIKNDFQPDLDEKYIQLMVNTFRYKSSQNCVRYS